MLNTSARQWPVQDQVWQRSATFMKAKLTQKKHLRTYASRILSVRTSFLCTFYSATKATRFLWSSTQNRRSVNVSGEHTCLKFTFEVKVQKIDTNQGKKWVVTDSSSPNATLTPFFLQSKKLLLVWKELRGTHLITTANILKWQKLAPQITHSQHEYAI